MTVRLIPGVGYIQDEGATRLIPGGGYVMGATAPVVLYRALILLDGELNEVPDKLVGSGVKPLVLLEGLLKERVDAEGLPVVLIEGGLQTLPSGGTLQI